jgi:hypothetical protein
LEADRASAENSSAGCIGVVWALAAEAALVVLCTAIIGLSNQGPGFSGAMSAFGFAMAVIWGGVLASPIVMILAFFIGRTRAQSAGLRVLQDELNALSVEGPPSEPKH